MIKKLNKDFSIKEDSVYVLELLNGLEDSPFKKQVEHNLYFYIYKARQCKYICNLLTAFTVAFPILVTAISAMSIIEPIGCKIFITIFSAASSISAGMLGTFRFKEEWIIYRSNSEKLKMEISLFLEKAEPYNCIENEDAKQLFINNCKSLFKFESIIWKEHTNKIDV